MKKFKQISILLFSLTFLFGCSAKSNVENKSLKEPQGITVNKISFDEVGMESLPPNMENSINNFKANRGYLVYEDKGYYYIAVFSGKRNTGGYSIKVLSIEDNEGKTNIVVEEKTPSQGAIVTQAITYPYTVVRVTGITPNINIKTTKSETMEKVMKDGEIY